MLRLAARRFAGAIPNVIGIVVVTFLLARALPGVPANVEALVARCLAFDKNERWSSATTMRSRDGGCWAGVGCRPVLTELPRGPSCG